MKVIKCPKCGKKVEVDIKNAVDEDAETFMCPHCHFVFRYVEH